MSLDADRVHAEKVGRKKRGRVFFEKEKKETLPVRHEPNFWCKYVRWGKKYRRGGQGGRIMSGEAVRCFLPWFWRTPTANSTICWDAGIIRQRRGFLEASRYLRTETQIDCGRFWGGGCLCTYGMTAGSGRRVPACVCVYAAGYQGLVVSIVPDNGGTLELEH